MAVRMEGGVTFDAEEALVWFRSSDQGERGFCSRCGTSLFWRLAEDPAAMTVVSAEALDDAEDLTLERHIYIDAKPARYDFVGDQPRITEAELMAELGIAPGEGS